MRLFTYDYGHYVREVAGSRLGCGAIDGGDFHPTRQLARFSPANMPYFVNSTFISNAISTIKIRQREFQRFSNSNYFYSNRWLLRHFCLASNAYIV